MPRPQSEIKLEQVTICAMRGMTKKETCAFIGVSEDTFARRFAEENSGVREAWYDGKLKGDAAIRNKLYENGVIKGKSAELIHLSKARLGMVEKQKVKVEHGGTIDHTVAQLADMGEAAIQQRLRELVPKVQMSLPEAQRVTVIPPVKRKGRKK